MKTVRDTCTQHFKPIVLTTVVESQTDLDTLEFAANLETSLLVRCGYNQVSAERICQLLQGMHDAASTESAP